MVVVVLLLGGGEDDAEVEAEDDVESVEEDLERKCGRFFCSNSSVRE